MIFAVVEVTDYNNNAQLEWHVISTIIHELLQNVDQARTLFDNEKISVKYVMKEGVMMSKAGAKFSEVKELLMKDEEFKTEYEKLKPRYDVISQIIEARTNQNITQEELALRVGTQKSNISRLESGTYNPSLDFLVKIAQCLGKEVQVILK